MIAALAETFRGVLCRRCDKPIRVPDKLERGRGQNEEVATVPHDLISRVFVLRCRCCEKESVYSVNQIADYPVRKGSSN
jgi:hypothetical protein